MNAVKVKDDLKSSYDTQYQQADSQWREMGAECKAKNIIELTKDLKRLKVLEVGAGDGSILKYLNDAGFSEELHALEISTSGVDQIRKKDIKTLKKVQVFDGYTIPYQDNYFDIVILSHVLEHVEFERSLLREIKRVARFQVIEVPRDYKRGVDKKVEHFLSYGHINLYTPTTLKFLLKTEGFTIIKEKLGTYDLKTFHYMARGSLKNQALYSLLWCFKKLMSSTPYTAETYCNTITVLCCSQPAVDG